VTRRSSRPAKKAPARNRSAGGSTSKRAPAKTSRTPAKPKGRADLSRSTTTTRRTVAAEPLPRRTFTETLLDATEGHRGDLVGLLVIGFGAVAGLGIYADSAGPVGWHAENIVSLGVGEGRYVAPPLLVLIGFLLIRGTPAPADLVDGDLVDGDVDADGYVDAEPRNGGRALRIGFGSVLLAVAGLGLLHLARKSPPLDAPADDLRAAAGYLGALIGSPLRKALSDSGAATILGLAGVAGLLVLTGTSLSQVGRAVLGAFVWLARMLGGLFSLGSTKTGDAASDTDAGADDAPAPVFFDQDAGARAKAAGQRKRGRKGPKEVSGLPIEGDAEPEQLQIALPPGAAPSNWKLPTLKLLDRSDSEAIDRRVVEETGRRLEHALAEHGVETRLVGMTVGPTVTRFELELGPGVKVARVTSLHKDIAYAMATPDVRILAPIPGKQAIGVEIPNSRKQLVTVGDILASAEARNAVHPLEVAIGRDIDGRSVMANLAGMPHILIAGATGAGKSSCLNSLLTSILMRSTPDQVRMILVDPKRVEMGQYNKLPHLLTEVVTNPKKAANALAWAVREMERRYDLLANCGFRDITGYNAAFDRGELKADLGEDVTYHRLPFILVVIDELADLMMVAARDVEESVCRLAQMARAVGIHLVIATQRPSVNVITGLIKANVPSRIAFAVSSLTDSRVILDQPGAERLLGKGDMLLLGPSSSIAQRVQGSWVNEAEVRQVVAHWRRQAPEVSYDEQVLGTDDASPGSGGGSGSGSGDGDDDDLVAQAMELVVRSQLGSTSMLQRKLRVGFARAGRLMDLLEQRGVVGPSTGSKARDVLMTVEELDSGAGSSGGGPDGDGPTTPLTDPDDGSF
jgi:S-DNA-T family DNA segregation ATPase FtsK/SpoIIIE